MTILMQNINETRLHAESTSTYRKPLQLTRHHLNSKVHQLCKLLRQQPCSIIIIKGTSSGTSFEQCKSQQLPLMQTTRTTNTQIINKLMNIMCKHHFYV